jgi:hypothetical protein
MDAQDLGYRFPLYKIKGIETAVTIPTPFEFFD